MLHIRNYYVSDCPDSVGNDKMLYCEVYTDCDGENKVDDFVIHNIDRKTQQEINLEKIKYIKENLK